MVLSVIVIIAAVIASFVFGLPSGVTRSVAIAVSAQQQGSDLVLTFMGGDDMPRLHRLDVTGTEADGTPITGTFANTPPAVGDTLRIADAGNPGGDHVVVVAELGDGSRHVVLDVTA